MPGDIACVSEITVPSGWRERLEAIAGRRRDSWVIVGLVATVAIAGLALWSRGRPAQVAPPAEAATTSFAGVAPAGSGEAAPAPSPTPVLVHVAGAVREPGLYALHSGARVADAIDAAGGEVARADVDALNLAEVVVDGGKVQVPRRGEAAPVASPTSVGGDVSSSGAPVSINTADALELESVPGLGPVKSAAIVEYRDQVGGFTSIEQLLDVSGIGPATLESIRSHVTL